MLHVTLVLFRQHFLKPMSLSLSDDLICHLRRMPRLRTLHRTDHSVIHPFLAGRNTPSESIPFLLQSPSRAANLILPRRPLSRTKLYCHLSKLLRVGFSAPDHPETRSPASVLYPKQISRFHLSPDPRKQGSTKAYSAGKSFLGEEYACAVPPIHRDNQLYLPSRLEPRFHDDIERRPAPADSVSGENRMCPWTRAGSLSGGTHIARYPLFPAPLSCYG